MIRLYSFSKHKYNDDMMKKRTLPGAANGWMIIAISVGALFFVASAFAVWSYISFIDTRSDVEGKIKVAEAEARNQQAELDRKNYLEESKNPRLEFVSPSEYGRVSFMYPRNWSVYIHNDGSDRRDYVAYLHPVTVPSVISRDSRFALKLEIINKDFDVVMKQYESLLKKGDLTSGTPEFNGNASTRIDGAFAKDLRGSVVLMRVRDKTIRFSTQADTFKPDFKTILDTVKFVE